MLPLFRQLAKTEWPKIHEWIERQETREVSEAEEHETGIVLSLLVAVFLVAMEFGGK